MKSIIAFSTWKNRIEPVLDVSQPVRIVVTDGRQILRQSQASVVDDQLHLKALRLATLKADALVCGAISPMPWTIACRAAERASAAVEATVT